MNREMGFLSAKLGRLTLLYLRMIRGKLAIGRIFTPQTSHEGSWCQAGSLTKRCSRRLIGLRTSPLVLF